MIDAKLIEKQGRTFVLYSGLLDLAHSQGLKAIRTTLIQIPTAENEQTAIVAAEVTTDRGTFCGLGDATPANVNRGMVVHLIRLAETRAKARALRDAVNVGVVALEELADVDELEQRPSPRPALTPIRAAPAPARTVSRPVPHAAVSPARR